MPVGWAVGAAAAAGLAGSVISASASQSAASTEAGAANNATAASQAENALTQANLAPYNQFGQMATSQLGNLIGNNGSAAQSSALAGTGLNSLTFQPTQAQLAATPGYQFDLSQGLQSIASSNAAKGLGVSGAALKGATSYATGLANNTLATQDSIFQNNYGNVMNPLTSAANLGENAAAGAGALGTANTNSANAASMAGASASAAGTVGSANALSSGLGSLGGVGTNYLLMNNLLGNTGAGSPSDINSWLSQPASAPVFAS